MDFFGPNWAGVESILTRVVGAGTVGVMAHALDAQGAASDKAVAAVPPRSFESCARTARASRSKGVRDTGQWAAVYDLRVAAYHTDFAG